MPFHSFVSQPIRPLANVFTRFLLTLILSSLSHFNLFLAWFLLWITWKQDTLWRKLPFYVKSTFFVEVSPFCFKLGGKTGWCDKSWLTRGCQPLILHTLIFYRLNSSSLLSLTMMQNHIFTLRPLVSSIGEYSAK